MRRLFGFAFALPAALALCGNIAHAQSLSSKIDQYMQASVKAYHFMGTILVAKDGKILIAKGYGMANIKRHIPNTANTEFRIGSITKQFTAMAILQLQAEGKLNVNDPVCKYIPKCPKDWQPIRISNLLDHTSGIPNYTGFKDFKKFEHRNLSPTQLLALFKNKPLDFKPGTKWSYSNSGYAVLGYIIRHVSGEPYKNFLQQHIFKPLAMKESGYDNNLPTTKNHAKGYRYAGGYKPFNSMNMSLAYSAGALYSTVGDLYTWDRALNAGKLLSKHALAQMFTPHAVVKGDMTKIINDTGNIHYGYGWFIDSKYGFRRYSHEGGIQGFTSLNSWFPKQHVYVIVLDNMTSSEIFAIDHSLTAIVFGKPYKIPEVLHAISLPAKDLKKFVGKYQLTPNMVMTITQKGDQLKSQLTGQKAFAIYPESKTRFFLKVVRAELFFNVNHDGKVTGLVLHQGGMKLPAKRISATKPAQTSKPKTVKLSPVALRKFVGEYQLAPSFSITISLSGDQLKAQGTGQPALPIFPDSKTEFFAKAVNAHFDFNVDSKGKVTGLVLHQAGRSIPGKKIK